MTGLDERQAHLGALTADDLSLLDEIRYNLPHRSRPSLFLIIGPLVIYMAISFIIWLIFGESFPREIVRSPFLAFLCLLLMMGPIPLVVRWYFRRTGSPWKAAILWDMSHSLYEVLLWSVFWMLILYKLLSGIGDPGDVLGEVVSFLLSPYISLLNKSVVVLAASGVLISIVHLLYRSTELSRTPGCSAKRLIALLNKTNSYPIDDILRAQQKWNESAYLSRAHSSRLDWNAANQL